MASRVYEMVRDRILAAMDAGTAPWHRPWSGGGAPANLSSRREYSGINRILAACTPGSSRWFVTFKQAVALGGNVRKGAKSTPIVFYSPVFSRRTEDGTKARVEGACILRYYSAFSLDQCEGIEDPDVSEVGGVAPDPVDFVERMVADMPKAPPIRWGGAKACYVPSEDVVYMPDRERFGSASGLYNTLLHELAHATGAAHRLGRRKDASGRSLVDYAAEELVAEVGACLAMQAAGLAPEVEQSGAYCASWAKAIRGMDSAQAVCRAFTAAAKAADWIQGRVPVETAAAD